MKSLDTQEMHWSNLSNIASVVPDHAGDLIAPGAVQDLSVSYNNDGEWTITFTCPGSDRFGSDPVAKLSIKYATAKDKINEANFHDDNLNEELTNDDLLPNSSLTPPTGNTSVTL